MMATGRRELLLLAPILLLATVLRVGWPGLTEFKFSEARLEALALELTREGRIPLIGVPSSAGFDHSPISVYLYAPAFLLTANPLPATICGGLAGVAAVALCWWLARGWPGGGRLAALVSALLFATSPWSVAFSRKIWQVAFVPLLSVAFVGLAVSALVQKRHWSLAWALLVYALLVQVHPSAVSLALVLLLWLLVFRREVRLGPLLAGSALGLLSAVPFLAHQMQSGWPVLGALRELPEAQWDLQAVRLAWEAITGQGIHALAGDAYRLLELVPRLGWIFNIIGWLVVGAALVIAWRLIAGWQDPAAPRREAARVDLILVTWLLAPILFNLRHSLALHLHFFALIVPAAYLIAGRLAQIALEAVESRGSPLKQSAPGPRILRMMAIGGLGLLAGAQVTALVLMGRFVATHDTPGGFGLPLSRYLEVAERALALADETDAAEVLVVGQGDSPVVDETPAIFDVLLRDQVAYRFVDGQSAAVFPPHRAVVVVAPGVKETAMWYQTWPAQDLHDGYRLVELDGSWPLGDLSAVEGPRLFQNGVELQGYGWSPDASPGQPGRLWLLWQVLWLRSDDTHFAVHLLDEKGQQWGQKDSVGYPTEYRRKGDRIISGFDITPSADAPPGPYWSRVALYLFPQIVNLPVIDEAGSPLAEAVLLVPQGRGP